LAASREIRNYLFRAEFPGDAEKDAERTMLAENLETDLEADVLKVGHHGSKNSTAPDFLAAVRPRMAITVPSRSVR
jgi:beta-lactamase superfamily II metal-dependent hydrolase